MEVIYSMPKVEAKELVFGISPVKRAVLIFGQEGSGTYMLWEAVSASIKLSKEDVFTERWSVPHAGKWPNLFMKWNDLVMSDYLVHALAIIREPRATINSINARRDQNLEPLNQFDYLDRLQYVLNHFDDMNFPRDIVSYEMFVGNENYRRELFEIMLGLPYPEDFKVYDGNAKYYKE